MNVEDWINRCADALVSADVWFGHGTDNAADEAAWLVLAAIGADTDGSFSAWDREVSAQQEQAIADLLGQRIDSRQPLAYLTGEAWFCGLKFSVDRNVLVPRSPIAELIRQHFSPWVRPERLRSALDLCTGSGCIALAMAHHMPWLRVDASDISREALQVAAQNRRMHDLEDRVTLLASDLFEGLTGRKYGLIVSNPPYVSGTAIDALPAEYRAEPELALKSRLQGLEIPLRILLDSPDHLEQEGVLICEVGENAEALQTLMPQLPLTWLEFEMGGGGVFTISRLELLGHHEQIKASMESLRNVG